MNHYVGLIVLAVIISAVFAAIMKDTRQEQIRYFFVLLAYMVVGSLVAAWFMYPIPW
ncbi:MAG: hypothetical protein HY645_13745 [Acidobacteria bacterium]|nr:hypothetical protein [Acidobacteriota bacterium]